jgi:hypothetical protein
MQIHAADTVEGVPLVKIRWLFLKAGLDGTVSRDLVRRKLKLTTGKADRLIAQLRDRGFLVPLRPRSKAEGMEDLLRLTKSGIRLRGATAAKPLHRATADRLLAELLDRIKALNGNDHFLARVRSAVAFGSYVGNADRVGDLDVAIELVRRERDFDRHREANDCRVAEELQNGRRFATFLDQLFWWEQEAMLFLRNRKRGLSLHQYGPIRETVDASPHRVVFQHDSRPLSKSKRP